MQTDNNSFSDSVSFVARHWRQGAFPQREVLASVTGRRFLFMSRGVAAAVIAVVAAGCAVAAFLWYSHALRTPEHVPVAPREHVAAPPPRHAVRRIELVDASMRQIAGEVREVYGVELVNLPSDDARLTLSYEGTADDFVATVNDLLGSDIGIAE